MLKFVSFASSLGTFRYISVFSHSFNFTLVCTRNNNIHHLINAHLPLHDDWIFSSDLDWAIYLNIKVHIHLLLLLLVLVDVPLFAQFSRLLLVYEVNRSNANWFQLKTSRFYSRLHFLLFPLLQNISSSQAISNFHISDFFSFILRLIYLIQMYCHIYSMAGLLSVLCLHQPHLGF